MHVSMAPRLGFEPRYTAPEAVVLPLDDLGICAKLWPDSIEMASAGQVGRRGYLEDSWRN